MVIVNMDIPPNTGLSSQNVRRIVRWKANAMSSATMPWRKGNVPTTFRDMPDDENWWPRNTRQRMGAVAARAGWIVISPDLELVKRDSIILLEKRAKSH